MYKVLTKFTDLQDNNHKYHAGDIFPREGLKASADRIKELSTSTNRRGIPLIEKVEESKKSEKTEALEETQELETEKSEEAEKLVRKRGKRNKE